MGDEQHGRAGIVDQRRQQVDDLTLRDRIQCRGRLVGDDESRRGDQRGGDADALLLPAGKLMWVFQQCILGKPHFVKHRLDTIKTLVKRQIVVQVQRQTDLLCNRHHGIERCRRILEHHAHITPAQIGHGGIVQPDQLPATSHDGTAHPRRVGQQPHQGFGDHGFARAGGTDQTDALTVGDVHARIAHDGFVADGDGQPTNLDAHAASLSSGLANGSMASRSASPNRCSAITVIVTISPGHSTVSG